MVQDSVYCFEAKGALDIAASKSHKIPGLKAFLEAQAKSYEEYYEDLYKEWHIKSANGICLNSACQNYVDELTSVAKDYDPIYLVAACIPCAKLWPWLGQELHNSQHNFGCYGTWVDENFNPTSVSYKKLEAFVNAAYVEKMIDEATLTKIYSTCMQCEADFFGSATA
ncbi:hypothetical protein FSP39_024217 [Pinctada imbricata]|uniref:Thiaminase-2/PQQC domain-containing protein n=1 Tax=Pinctada imbricata TaxID=66713 RepID=A0AA88XK38_PINIB|nr:hypothetical protein FSP39_024217 [Pinctada imbricata]